MPCDVLYFFWVMQSPCLQCHTLVDLSVLGHRTERLPQPEAGSPDPLPLVRRHLSGPSWPGDGDLPLMRHGIHPVHGRAKGAKATCGHLAAHKFMILDAVASTDVRPRFRLYGKLVLTRGGARNIDPPHPKTRRHTGSVRQDSGRKLSEVRSCRPGSRWRTATTRARP